jgi:hypothetical protein
MRLEGRNYWAVTPRQSVGAGGYAWYTSADVHDFAFEDVEDVEDLLGIEAIHALSLRSVAASLEKGDLRLETGLGLQRLHQERDRFGRESEHVNAVARISLFFRHAWGLVRINVFLGETLGGDQ